MQKYLKIIILLVGFCLLICACTKYQDDPFISFKKSSNRIIGTWNIVSYQIKGIEHNHDFDSLLYPKTLTDYFINFDNTSTDNKTYPISSGSDNGVYKFIDKDKSLLFASSNVNTYGFESGKNSTSENILEFNTYDTTFINLFFFQQRNRSLIPYGANEFSIIKLYDKDLHISNNSIDIFLKKQ